MRHDPKNFHSTQTTDSKDFPPKPIPAYAPESDGPISPQNAKKTAAEWRKAKAGKPMQSPCLKLTPFVLS